jgi:hypothetical protein
MDVTVGFVVSRDVVDGTFLVGNTGIANTVVTGKNTNSKVIRIMAVETCAPKVLLRLLKTLNVRLPNIRPPPYNSLASGLQSTSGIPQAGNYPLNFLFQYITEKSKSSDKPLKDGLKSKSASKNSEAPFDMVSRSFSHGKLNALTKKTAISARVTLAFGQ